MKHSYLLAGTTFGQLVGLLRRNGFSPYPKYLFRLLFLLQNGIWASIFKRREKIRFGKELLNAKPPENPIFIIGHWRTGSTFLHQLMSQDGNLVTPNVFQVSVPQGFLVSEKYYKPMMSSVMGKHRPMDNVKIGFYEPQEDEYAILKLSKNSPLENLVFPKHPGYFLDAETTFEPQGKARQQWKNQFLDFSKKLVLKNHKQLLFKNPFHSMRVKLLRELFPKARFIHIHRHPFKVIPSSIHMWNVVGSQNCLRGNWVAPTAMETTKFLDHMLSQIQSDLKSLPETDYVEMGFEQLEADPLKGLKYIYDRIGLPYEQAFEENVKSFLETIKNYKKNIYNNPSVDKERISEVLSHHMKRYQYTDPSKVEDEV